MEPFTETEIDNIITNSKSMSDFPELKNYVMGDPKNDNAVVLQHGFIGSPLDWMFIASQLAHKYRVILPLLPGHGKHAREMHGISYKEWVNATNDAVDFLREEKATRKIVLAGHSLGGSISLILAAKRNDITAVVTFSSPVRYKFLVRAPIKILGILFRWHYMKYSEFAFDDKTLYENAYIKFLNENYNEVSIGTLRQVLLLIDEAYKSLPHITIPYLNMHSIYDKTVPYNNVDLIMQKIASECKKHVKLNQSYHGIIADTDKIRVREELLAFLETEFGK